MRIRSYQRNAAAAAAYGRHALRCQRVRVTMIRLCATGIFSGFHLYEIEGR